MKTMEKLLQKISWKTRKIKFNVSLFDLYLHDSNESWGFRLLNFRRSFTDYSLLKFEFRLPNGANIRRFSVDSWDIFFMYPLLWEQYDNLSDSEIWGIKHTGWSKIKLIILTKLFK